MTKFQPVLINSKILFSYLAQGFLEHTYVEFCGCNLSSEREFASWKSELGVCEKTIRLSKNGYLGCLTEIYAGFFEFFVRPTQHKKGPKFFHHKHAMRISIKLNRIQFWILN